ncbi:MAG TPA: adenosine deaminase [Candidatus Limnocylindria bacterium]|nr:adenosine deaminase [Candidatus Limnocylindria bacterium]
MTTPTTHEPTIVDSLPKAELHLHLEGSIRPDTAVELAARHGVKIKREEVVARYNFSDFTGFLEAFKWVTSYLREPEDYALVTRHLAEELLRQNVVYAEVTISAGVMLRRTQSVEANLTAIQETAKSVPFARLRMAWILDATRQFGPDAAVEVARCASQLQRHGVVAFGMGGDELAGPTVNFRPAFDLARNEGLRLVCHAGEVGGPESIRESIDLLSAERIGHGIAVMRDPALTEFLAARRVPLEICPTSNLCTGALAKQTGKVDASLQDHPLAKFIKQGLTLTLSTDDPAMFHTDLLSEYSVAASLGLSSQQLVQLAEQSVSASFLPPEDKRQMLDDFRAAAKSLLL